MAFVVKLTNKNGLPDMRFEGNSGEGVTIFTEGSSGDARFMTIMPGSNGYEISVLTSLPENNGLRMDEDGYPTVFKT